MESKKQISKQNKSREETGGCQGDRGLGGEHMGEGDQGVQMSDFKAG